MTNGRGEYLGPGFYSISPQQNSTFWMKNNKNTVISAISKKSKQKDAGIYFIKRTWTW